jgi:hypothetical protein
MVLAGYADVELSLGMIRERPFNEAEHVVWSVPPQAAAGLVDRPGDWADLGDVEQRDE